ncbi:MAG: hypothetical protein ACR2PZ_07140 [Pseudomonadales bacterium]
MSDNYRLVFRGEVGEGQHPAVVKKRLAKVLKLEADKVEKLFTGSTVVLRRSVDATTAARYQAAFKEAGARLRVQPIREESETPAPVGASDASASQAETSDEVAATTPASDVAAGTDAAETEYGFRLLPVGSYILEVHERLPPVEANIAIGHLALADTSTPSGSEDSTDPDAVTVDVDHLSVADAGATLGSDTDASAAPERVIEFEFELAEDGSWLSEEDDEDGGPSIDAPDFTLAEPGALLQTAAPKPQASAPDVSHLSLEDDESNT